LSAKVHTPATSHWQEVSRVNVH